jgi:hypothetical protein
MAFSFDDTLLTDADWIRFYIGDTVLNSGPRPNSAARNFPNASIAAVLSDEGHKVAAVAALFEALSTEWARYNLSEREGEVNFDAKGTADYYAKLADEWRSKPDGGGSSKRSMVAGVVGLDIASKGDDWE